MKAPPAFQFYPDDFLGGTIHFSNDEVGLYIRLLCVQWNTGGLVDDDDELASYGKGDAPIHRVKAKFQKGEDGLLRNERLEAERKKQIEYREARAADGRKGGGNPNFQRGRPNPYFGNKGEDKGGLSLGDKGEINSPSPSPSPSTGSLPLSGGGVAQPKAEGGEDSLPVEPHRDFPVTEADAVVHADFVGCTKEFAALIWNKATGRGGRDAKDIEIRNWRAYLRTEWTYQQERDAKESKRANGPGADCNKGTANGGIADQKRNVGKVPQSPAARVFELKTVMEAKVHQANDLLNRYAAEGPLETTWSSQAHQATYRKLKGEIKELRAKIGERSYE